MISIFRRYSTISSLMSIDLKLSGTTLAYMKDHERKHLVRCQNNSKLGEKRIPMKGQLMLKYYFNHKFI